MRAHIGADSLAFLSLDGMIRAISGGARREDDGYCNACFTGKLPNSLHASVQPKLACEGVLA